MLRIDTIDVFKLRTVQFILQLLQMLRLLLKIPLKSVSQPVMLMNGLTQQHLDVWLPVQEGIIKMILQGKIYVHQVVLGNLDLEIIPQEAVYLFVQPATKLLVILTPICVFILVLMVTLLNLIQIEDVFQFVTIQLGEIRLRESVFHNHSHNVLL